MDTAELETLINAMPPQFRAPVYSYAKAYPFVQVPGVGEPIAAYTAPRIELRDSFFTENKSWCTLLHECVHGILQEEQTTFGLLHSGDLMLSLLGQNPQDPKFNDWRVTYSGEGQGYQFTLANGKVLMDLCNLPMRDYDVFPFGNYIETMPAIVELYARKHTRNWPAPTKPLINWVMQRYAQIENYSL